MTTKRLTRLAVTSFLLAALILISLPLASYDASGDTPTPLPPSNLPASGGDEPPDPHPAHTTLVIHYPGQSPPPALMNRLANLRAAGKISALDAASEPGRVFVLGEEKALQAVKERFDVQTAAERDTSPPERAIPPAPPTPLSPPEQIEVPEPQTSTTFYLTLDPTQPVLARERLVRRLEAIGPVSQQGHSLRLTAPATAAKELSHLPGLLFVSQAPESGVAGVTANGTITGVVTADDTALPLVGVSVYVYESATGGYVNNGNTDASGVYSISLPGGTYRVLFNSTDYHVSEYYNDVPYPMPDSHTPVTVVDDTVTPNINASLAPGAQIIGTVTDQASANPLPNISIYATDLDYDYQTWGNTDANGVYTTTPGLPAGSYRVEFRDYNGVYALEYYDDVYLPSQATWIEITSTHRTGIDAALAQAAVITGTVTGPAPLENIYVSAYYATENQFFDSDYTDVSGTFRLDGLSPIGYKLRFLDNNGRYLEEWHQDKPDWDTADPITLTSGATTTVNAELTAAGLISGTITGQDSGLPLESIRTRVYDAATGDYVSGDYTDGSGVYLIGGLAAGNYKLRFTDYDGQYLEEYYDDKPDLDSADPIAVTGGITATASAELAPAGLISGTVTAEDSGLPLVNIRARVYDASTGGFITSDYTDDAGVYLINGLQAGSYKLRFTDNDGRYLEEYYDDKPDLDSADPIAVTGGITATASAELAPAGLISGTVTAEAGGARLEGINVSAYEATSGDYVNNDYTDTSGAYLVGGLAAGSYKLRFYDNDGQYLTEYYDDKPDLDSANPIAVTAGVTTTDVNAQLAQAGLVSGTVTGEDTGLPLTNVRARAYEAATGDYVTSDYTDDSGVYLITGLAAGSYKLRFTDYDGNYLEEYYDDKPDLDSANPIAVTAGVTTTANADLAPAGLISGTITAEMGGAPLDGISVYAYKAASGDYVNNDYTDATGAYLVGGLASGSYKLRFSDSDNQYLTEYYDDKPDLNSADPVAVTAGVTTTNVNAQLAQAGLVSGTVTGEDTGLPLTNVRVRAYEAATGDYINSDYTDDSGHYLVGGLAPGPHKLRFTDYDERYLEEYYDDKPDLNNADPITITAGVTTTGIDAQLTRAGLVSGTVTGEDTGLPLTNVRVRIYEAATDDYLDSDYTDGSGVYLIGELATGAYKLRFTDQDGDYLEEYYADRLNLSSADPVSVTAGTTTTVDAALSRGGRITGRVTDAETGLGLEDVYVDVDRMDASTPSGSAYTDASGYYTTSALYSGVYRVNFNPDPPYYEEDYDNFETGDDFSPVVVTAPLTVTPIDAALTPGYFISGTVTGSGSDPLEDVRVEAYYSADSHSSDSDYSDDQGRYLLGPLDPGPYRVLFKSPDLHASQWYSASPDYVGATVINLNGDRSGIDAELSLGSRITGTVTGADGDPLPDVWVYVYPAGSEESIASGETDADGHYATESGLATGWYQVHFSAPTGHNSEWYDSKAAQADATLISVTAGISQTHVNARLSSYPTGAISGHITAADTGEPLNGWVYAYNPAGSSVRSVYASGGSYMLDSLPPNTYRVRFSSLPSPYIQTYYDTQFELDSATPVTVTAGMTVTDINQAIPRGGAITGTVSGSGGLAGVYVYARRVVGSYATRSTYTGPDGAYSLQGMEPGEYSLEFSPPSPFIRQWYDGALLEDDAQTVTVTLGTTTPGINAALATGGVITGAITAADTGEPLFSAYVRVYSATGSFSSDSVYADMDGGYQTAGLPAGDYQVDFDAGRWDFYRDEWYQDAPSRGEGMTVTLPASGTVPHIDADLEKGGSISGWTYDAETELVLPDVYAAAYEAADVSYVGYDYSNDWGFYQIPALESGAYKVKFTESGYADQWYREALDSDSALTVTVAAPDDSPNINAYLYQSHPYGIYLPIVLRGQP